MSYEGQLHNSPNYAKLKPSDISEFEPICNRKLTHNRDELIKLLKSLKEKCGHPTTEQCAKCKECVCNSEHDIGCILKLFENFEGFVPQPHQGHEFGDISMLVSIDGRNLTFLGAAKSGINKITKSSQLGREIIQQTLDALNDLRAEVIGTIYPGLLDDQLKYLLYHEAKFLNADNVYLTPNMTYYPRVIRKPKNTLVNGSVAILVPKQDMVLTNETIEVLFNQGVS